MEVTADSARISETNSQYITRTEISDAIHQYLQGSNGSSVLIAGISGTGVRTFIDTSLYGASLTGEVGANHGESRRSLLVCPRIIPSYDETDIVISLIHELSFTLLNFFRQVEGREEGDVPSFMQLHDEIGLFANEFYGLTAEEQRQLVKSMSKLGKPFTDDDSKIGNLTQKFERLVNKKIELEKGNNFKDIAYFVRLVDESILRAEKSITVSCSAAGAETAERTNAIEVAFSNKEATDSVLDNFFDIVTNLIPMSSFYLQANTNMDWKRKRVFSTSYSLMRDIPAFSHWSATNRISEILKAANEIFEKLNISIDQASFPLLLNLDKYTLAKSECILADLKEGLRGYCRRFPLMVIGGIDLYRKRRDGLHDPNSHLRSTLRRGWLLPPSTPLELKAEIKNILQTTHPASDLRDELERSAKFGVMFGGGFVTPSYDLASLRINIQAQEVKTDVLGLLLDYQNQLHRRNREPTLSKQEKFVKSGSLIDEVWKAFDAFTFESRYSNSAESQEDYVARLMFAYDIFYEINVNRMALFHGNDTDHLALFSNGYAVSRHVARKIGPPSGQLLSSFLIRAWPMLLGQRPSTTQSNANTQDNNADKDVIEQLPKGLFNP
jgi:hypothetical protein